jgi:ribonuclease T1
MMFFMRIATLLLSFTLLCCLEGQHAPNPLAPTTPGIEAPTALSLDEVPTGERDAVIRVAGLIDRGGPFPYRQDGSTFQNREQQLPRQPSGFWHEYTVPTPGSPDRGARRIVAGNDDSLHYTNNHYASFVRIRAP